MMINLFRNTFKTKTFNQFLNDCRELDESSFLLCHGQREYQDRWDLLQFSIEEENRQYRINYMEDGLSESIYNEKIFTLEKIEGDHLARMKELVHLKAKNNLNKFIDLINLIPAAERNDIQLVKENKSLEWLGHTCDFLRDAMTSANERPYQFLKYMFFIEFSDHSFIHLRVFNLEFLVVIHEQSLHIEVYDYKNKDDKLLKMKERFQFVHKQAFDQILKNVILGNKILLN